MLKKVNLKKAKVNHPVRTSNVAVDSMVGSETSFCFRFVSFEGLKGFGKEKVVLYFWVWSASLKSRWAFDLVKTININSQYLFIHQGSAK